PATRARSQRREYGVPPSPPRHRQFGARWRTPGRGSRCHAWWGWLLAFGRRSHECPNRATNLHRNRLSGVVGSAEVGQSLLEPSGGRSERLGIARLEHELDGASVRPKARVRADAHLWVVLAGRLEHRDDPALGRAIGPPP